MRIKSIIAAMRKDKYPDDIISRFENAADTNSYAEAPFEFAQLMDLLLTEEQRLSLWERNGGRRMGRRHDDALAFRAEHADKTLDEKLARLGEVRSLGNFRRNEDGTITAGNGCHLCILKKGKPSQTVTPTLFGCSAGGAFYNYETALGVKLRMKSIDVDPAGGGNSPYSFTFEVVACRD